ncbi:hypothetical protein L1987_32677 [Smallanthus sonchifolius]|uniref:Uncharacterized protein n=1 Tax=Smallanthus sonchifolius TaxID=185202 RepID=A0ACB9HQM2_9ASTR|nr:hypothetical protein L1987_32677 [Smallanthus sonchifolius]
MSASCSASPLEDSTDMNMVIPHFDFIFLILTRVLLYLINRRWGRFRSSSSVVSPIPLARPAVLLLWIASILFQTLKFSHSRVMLIKFREKLSHALPQ